MKNLGKVAYILIIIGALNWGLIGIANINLVAEIFGGGSNLTKIIYILSSLSMHNECVNHYDCPALWISLSILINS